MTPERTASQERWLRFFNRVVYDALPPAYDSLNWLTFGAWWRLISRALDYIPPGGQVLEVGFGPGRLHAVLARQSDLCVGLDLAWGMCHFTQRRLQRAGLPIRLTRGSMFELPYATGTFDVVVSSFALSGVHDGGEAVREMARVTRAGGRLVLIDIGLPEDGNRAGVFLARLWEWMGDFLYDQPAMMRQAGLQVVEFKSYGPGNHIRVMVGDKQA